MGCTEVAFLFTRDAGVVGWCLWMDCSVVAGGDSRCVAGFGYSQFVAVRRCRWGLQSLRLVKLVLWVWVFLRLRFIF